MQIFDYWFFPPFILKLDNEDKIWSIDTFHRNKGIKDLRYYQFETWRFSFYQYAFKCRA